jgi:2-polyprenyl-6-methoxyphenol hydroxylase-like FAD-dependent oxidoreductase
MLKVAIAGGGIGGLVLALALRERGIGVDVYEQAPELREIGAAVALSANGTRELRRLGLTEQVEAVSAQAHGESPAVVAPRGRSDAPPGGSGDRRARRRVRGPVRRAGLDPFL